MRFLCFLYKKNKKLFLFKKTKKSDERNRWVVVLIKAGFSQPRLFFTPFCDITLIARSGISHVTISLNGCAPHI